MSLPGIIAQGLAILLTLAVSCAADAPAFVAVGITRHADGQVSLHWQARAGAWYQVEHSSDLATWTMAGPAILKTSGSAEWTDAASTSPKRFYRVRDWGVFTVAYTNNNFTYTDAGRTVTGIFIKPAGQGPFPALVINHGTGGGASGFGVQRANEMSPWGLACIAANLTHTGGTPDLQTWGYSPENLARIRACIAVLATRSDVDLNRLAMWGHSRGAFATIGASSALGPLVKVMGASAGGITEDPGTTELTLPTFSEASGIIAPSILFHGSTDPTVEPQASAKLETLLLGKGITCRRIVYDTSAVSLPAAQHNLHQDATIYAEVLDEWQAWLRLYAVLP